MPRAWEEHLSGSHVYLRPIGVSGAIQHVFLHGFTGRPESWLRVIQAHLPARSAAWALPGHDPRAPVNVVAGFDGAVDALAASIKAVVSDPVVLVGYSLGARFGLSLALRHPSLVERAVLVGVHPGLDPAACPARREGDERWISLLEREGLAAFVGAWQSAPMWDSQAGLPTELLEEQRSLRLMHDSRALAASLHTHGLAQMPNRWAQLSDLAAPTTLVTGELDRKFGALAARAAPLLPHGRHLTIGGAGHNVPLERPGALARAVFLASEN